MINGYRGASGSRWIVPLVLNSHRLPARAFRKDPRKPLQFPSAFDYGKGEKYIPATHIARSDLIGELPEDPPEYIEESVRRRVILLFCVPDDPPNLSSTAILHLVFVEGTTR